MARTELERLFREWEKKEASLATKGRNDFYRTEPEKRHLKPVFITKDRLVLKSKPKDWNDYFGGWEDASRIMRAINELGAAGISIHWDPDNGFPTNPIRVYRPKKGADCRGFGTIWCQCFGTRGHVGEVLEWILSDEDAK